MRLIAREALQLGLARKDQRPPVYAHAERQDRDRPHRERQHGQSWNVHCGASSEKSCQLQPLRGSESPSHSTTSVGFRSTGRDTLWKFGEVAITAAWISANCSLVPLPLTRTV